MPKLLIIGAALNSGAPGRIAEETGRLAISKGWTVYHAHGLRYVNPTKLNEITVSSKTEEYVHAFKAKLLDLHGLGSKRATQKLVEKIKVIQPDVIHLHNLHGYFINFEVLFNYLKTINTPVVWTMHDCWPFTGRCFHFVGVDCYKWKTGCHDCKSETGYTVSTFCDKSKQLYELKKKLFTQINDMTMVPVSEWLGAFLKDSYLAKYPIRVIHNGVDTNKFKPMDDSRLRKKHNLNGKFVLLGVAAPWNKRKGMDDFVKLRSMLNDEFAIVLVGLQQTQIEKLPNGIIGIERTESQQELAEYYSMADLFVNLTYLDTFPTVNLEALACGTPVLTYRTGGSPEAIDEKTGVIVNQGDLVDVTHKICELRCRVLDSKDCRERVLRMFDKDKCFEEYIDMYNSLLNK